MISKCIRIFLTLAIATVFCERFCLYSIYANSLSSENNIFNIIPCSHRCLNFFSFFLSFFFFLIFVFMIRSAVACSTYTFSTGVSSGVTLSGSTTASVVTTCASGFSIGGGLNTQGSVTYTCTGTGPAVSAWSPTPSVAATSCQSRVHDLHTGYTFYRIDLFAFVEMTFCFNSHSFFS